MAKSSPPIYHYSAALLLVAILGIISVARFQNIDVSYSSSDASDNVATLSIILDDQTRRTFTGPVYDDTTILAAMIAASRAGNFPIRYHKDINGVVHIEQYDGLHTSDDQGCDTVCVLVNGSPIGTSHLDAHVLGAGDIVEVSSRL